MTPSRLQVKVPFLPEFKERLIAGRKWATTRTKRLGDVGDQFVAFGQRFEFTKVCDLPLFAVAAEHYQAEGFTSPEGFIDIWNNIHPRVRYNEIQRVYYHEFKLVPS